MSDKGNMFDKDLNREPGMGTLTKVVVYGMPVLSAISLASGGAGHAADTSGQDTNSTGYGPSYGNNSSVSNNIIDDYTALRGAAAQHGRNDSLTADQIIDRINGIKSGEKAMQDPNVQEDVIAPAGGRDREIHDEYCYSCHVIDKDKTPVEIHHTKDILAILYCNDLCHTKEHFYKDPLDIYWACSVCHTDSEDLITEHHIDKGQCASCHGAGRDTFVFDEDLNIVPAPGQNTGDSGQKKGSGEQEKHTGGNSKGR